jgi:hypothetical protein
MKNLTKLLGIIALAVVIGFAMAGCEQPTDLPTGSPTGKTLTGITLNTDSVKKTYSQNETLNLSGLVVSATYSDSSSAAVTNYTASPANNATLSTTGTITVTVSYTEGAVTKTADFSVTVTPTLTGITAEYTGTTHHVYTFTLLDSLKDHLTVKAQYSDSTSATLEAADYTLSGTLTADSSTITVTYQGKEATFTVTVTPATLDSIAVAFDQDDATIYTSTPLDNLKQYLTVTATYTLTGNEQTLEETLSAHEYTLSGELTAGTPTVTVNYGDKTENFTPTVTAVVLTGITAQYGTATVYTSTPSDNLKQYLTVKAVYNDGSEKTLTANEYTLSGTLTAGTPTITVTYEGQTATFTPTVTAVVLDSITANYTGGQVEINSNIDSLKTALTVTAHYNDGSTQTPSNYSLSGVVTTIGQKTITASYTDGGVTKTTTFNVTVVCTNHNWGSWTPTKNATDRVDGEESRMCSICGTTGETRILYATGTAGLSFININSNTAIRVSRGTATGAIHIPAYYLYNGNYLPVTTISNGVDTSNSNAFGGNPNNPNTTVTSVTFAEGSPLTTISDYAFRSCHSLTSINIPAGVTSISTSAFNSCTSLTSVTFAEGVTSIGGAAFSNCTSLASINIPASVTTIGTNAFWGCTGLTSITLPVITIGSDVFQDCNSIETVTFIDGSSTSINNCFANRSSLTSITIPASVTSISTGAFNGCTALRNIVIDTDKVTTTTSNNWGTIFPADNLSVTFKKNVGDYAFRFTSANSTKLTSVTFAEGVTSIGQYAFYNCTGLTSVTIPASVTSIGTNAFQNCTGLTSVTFAEGVTSIGQSPFSGCTGLTSITIPASVTSIAPSAFAGLNGLTSITVNSANTNYASEGGILYDKTKTTLILYPSASGSITIPNSVTSIGNNAFASCASLTSVTIPNSVTSIDYSAFYNCTSLTSVTIPASVTSIGNQAFLYCNRLTSVTFNGTIASTSFSTSNSFPGDLRDKYLAAGGGMGTYTRPNGTSTTWTRQ